MTSIVLNVALFNGPCSTMLPFPSGGMTGRGGDKGVFQFPPRSYLWQSLVVVVVSLLILLCTKIFRYFCILHTHTRPHNGNTTTHLTLRLPWTTVVVVCNLPLYTTYLYVFLVPWVFLALFFSCVCVGLRVCL